VIILHYCEKCLENLTEYGELCGELYEEIVLYFLLMEKPLEFCTENCAGYAIYSGILKYLELKGCVVSSESGITTLKIIPKGLTKTFEYEYEVCFNHEQID